MSSEASEGDSPDAIIHKARKWDRNTPLGRPDRPAAMSHIALALLQMFEETGQASKLLDEAISFAYKAAMETTPAGSSSWLDRLSNYGKMVSMRYEIKGNLDDLGESIRVGKTALDASPVGHPERASNCADLALSLYLRACSKIAEVDDLDEAITLAREASNEASITSQRPEYLNTLGNALGERYDRKHAPQDFQEAIESFNTAIALLPAEHPRLIGFQNNLANVLGFKYERFANVSDIDMCIQYRRTAIQSTHTNHPHRATFLTNLGLSLTDRYMRTGCEKNLLEAIELAKEAVSCTLDGDTRLADRLNNLGSSLHALFDRNGSRETLIESIEAGKRAIAALSTNAASGKRAMLLNNLGVRLASLFRQNGDLQTIEKAIGYTQKAVETAPLELHYKNNLCEMYNVRFEILGAVDDLSLAIECVNEVIKETPPDHARLPSSLGKLANILFNQFERQGDPHDLYEAINNARKALSKTPSDHPNRVERLFSLTLFLLSSYRLKNDPKILDETLENEEVVLNHMPEDHPQRASALHVLSLIKGFQANVNPHDDGKLQEALRDVGDAEKICRTARRGDILLTHAMLLHECFRHGRNPNFLTKATSKYAEAFEEPNSRPITRIRAGTIAGALFEEAGEHIRAYEILRAVTGLLPRLSLRSLSRDDQEHALRTVSGLSTLAASAALETKKLASEALVLLESCRGVISNFAIESRTNLPDLEKANKPLHDEYIALRAQLSLLYPAVSDLTEISDDPISASTERIDLQAVDEISKRSRLIRELERVEATIRKEVKGHQHFPHPDTSPEYFKNLARECGAGIVAFNVTAKRSDALIVTRENIKAIQLPALNRNELRANVSLLIGKRRITGKGTARSIHKRNQELRRILKWLWDVAVQPVLQELGMLSHTSSKLSRLWWVTSGLMGLTPLHAAGENWVTGTNNTASHVVSSYIPTFRALDYAREQSHKRLKAWQHQKCLIVVAPKAPGFNDLDLSEELAAIKDAIQNFAELEKVLEYPSKIQVLNQLKYATIVHFACHGNSNAKNPSSSGLYLHDSEKLTVRDLSNASLDMALLAYLSACSTAENSSIDLRDEVIHVASAFLSVGFPHTIGTIWEADDNTAANISRLFYEELKKNAVEQGVDLNEVIAYTFHEAVKAVREGRLTKGSQPNKRASNDAIGWAPFIHMGC